MRRLALGCAWLALTAHLAGCGDDDDVKPDVDAALPDASTEPDASAALLGNWHVVELDFRDDGGTRQTVRPTETVQTNDAGVVINRGRISGTFSLDPEVWSLGQAIVLNGRTIVPGGMTNVQVTWTASDTQFMLPLNNVVDYMLQGIRLIMNTGGVTIRFGDAAPPLCSKSGPVGDRLPVCRSGFAIPFAGAAVPLRGAASIGGSKRCATGRS